MATICKCGGIKRDGECNRCGKVKAPKKERKENDDRYTRYNWRTFSRRFREQYPFCAHCLRKGVLTAISTGDGMGCVDHIIRVKSQDDPLFWEHGNLQGLCIRCHSKKTVLEDFGDYTNSMIRDDQIQRKLQIDANDSGKIHYVITGEPGSGKSTRSRTINRNALVFDLDLIAASFNPIWGKYKDRPADVVDICKKIRKLLISEAKQSRLRAYVFIVTWRDKANEIAEELNANLIDMTKEQW